MQIKYLVLGFLVINLVYAGKQKLAPSETGDLPTGESLKNKTEPKTEVVTKAQDGILEKIGRSLKAAIEYLEGLLNIIDMSSGESENSTSTKRKRKEKKSKKKEHSDPSPDDDDEDEEEEE